MEDVTAPADGAATLIDGIARHLSHPALGRVAHNSGDPHTSRLQVKKEKNIVRDETTPSQNLEREAVRAANTASGVRIPAM